MRDFKALYGVDLAATVCPACDRAFLVAPASLPQRCPHCLDETLDEIENSDQLPPTPAPELVVPFGVSADDLAQQIKAFANSYRFTPPDLTPEKLKSRLTPQYLPVWLVDCKVSTKWQAEVGFDYEVVSHSEAYRGGRWQTTERRKTRTNWEPRVGELDRQYDNMRANALDEHAELVNPLGKFKAWEAVAYNSAEHAQSALFRLPNRNSIDAWNDVVPEALQRTEKDCMTAASGQHIRQFHWSPTFGDQHWTTLLLPVYTTYYLDDHGNQIALLVHGRSGQLMGPKVASMALAKRTSLIITAVALLCILLVALSYVGVTGDALLVLMCPAVLLGLAAIWPIVYASNLNSKRE